MLVCLKDPVPVKERKGVVYFIPCVECSIVYIGQTGRSVTEHVFKTEHAVDLSQSEKLDHHQHTTTHCM